MRILTADWSPDVNYLIVECDCGRLVRHRADRWNITCIACRKKDNLQLLRERYLTEKQTRG